MAGDPGGASEAGAEAGPWRLNITAGTSEYERHRDERKEGPRGRFGMRLRPLFVALGVAEVERNAKNKRMRAL